MSKQSWAAIVYGRSYHLDFRFITIPHDFTAKEIAWAAPYILATTQQARNLANFPRWSLFKNDSYCVVGVTCMVRDLLEESDEDLLAMMTKDDRGRPLYVFVGYVTQLNSTRQYLQDLPIYQGRELTVFQPLYQEIEEVWLAKEYEARQPRFSQYQILENTTEVACADNQTHHFTQLSLNNQLKHPQQTFLWSRSKEQNLQLWLASAKCSTATSLVVNIQGKQLINSPFLNQTASKINQFTTQERIINEQPASKEKSESHNSATIPLKQKISLRAKEDLDLTLQQAAKVTSAGQEFVQNFNPWSQSDRALPELRDHNSSAKTNPTPENWDNFGFKTKEQSSQEHLPNSEINPEITADSGFIPATSPSQDWF